MIEIAYSREKEILKNMQQEVQETIVGILQILDTEYGVNRNKYEDNGGYVIIIESEEDFDKIKDKTYLELESDAIPEYVDLIYCSNGEIYTNTLVLCNNDFVISIIMPLEITPKNLKEYIVGKSLT